MEFLQNSPYLNSKNGVLQVQQLYAYKCTYIFRQSTPAMLFSLIGSILIIFGILFILFIHLRIPSMTNKNINSILVFITEIELHSL